uniref:Uncharacterized protein n=1 Tax=Vitis vinifera TaxID=29760 RepID=A5BLF2_VITVI|nr:hypothetical protein VITISV_010563 [Vitis vinifera]
MAGIWCSSTVSSTLHLRVTVASKIAVYLFWEYVNFFWFRQHLQKRVHGIRCCSTTPDNKEKTPQLLRIAVGGVTELLRLVSFGQNRLDSMSYKQGDELLVSCIDDVLLILKSDYENAYFVTGKDLYSRNLKLLVPFFDHPSIALQKIEKMMEHKAVFYAGVLVIQCLGGI